MKYLNPINDQLLRLGVDATKHIDLKAAFGDSYTTFTLESSDGSAIDASIVDGVLTVSAHDLGYTDLVITAATDSGAVITDNVRINAAGANAFTIAALPDTQNYTLNPALNYIFGDMTEWLSRNADSLNIDFVIGLGDVTDNNNAAQWAIAEAALRKLDGQIPYSILPGNHDQAAGGSAANHSTDFLDTIFSPEAQATTNPDTFGGVYDREPDRSANTYHTFSAPDGTKWMVLSLEFAPRDDVLRWAGEVIGAHQDHRVILASHTLTNYASRSDPMAGTIGAAPVQSYGVANSPEGVNDGENVYRLLTSQYPNVVMTLSGHVLGDAAETNVSYSQFGNPVLEMFADYQGGSSTEIVTRGGEGAIRLLTIDPDNGRIFTSTYFTDRDEYMVGYRDKPELDRDGLTGPYRDHQQEFTGLALGTPEQFAVARAGKDLFLDAEAGADSVIVALDASASLNSASAIAFEWRDADGRLIATTAQASIDLGAGKHRLTLSVTDASGKVSTDEKLVMVRDENTLLIDNFNDGDAAGWSRPPAPPTPDLADRIAFGAPADFGLPDGPDAAMAFPALAPTTEGFHIRPDFATTGPLKSYTLAMDVLVSSQYAGKWFALLQTDPAQSSSNDADFLINKAGGVGISGDYKGAFQYDQWQRIVVTLQDLGNGTSTMARYIDGEFVGSLNLPTSRFQIDPDKGFAIFSDNAPNGSDLQTQPGYVGGVMLTDRAMSAAEVAALGGTSAGGILASAPTTGNTLQFNFTGAEPLAPSLGDGAFNINEYASIHDATHFGTAAELGIPALSGDASDSVMAFPAVGPDEGYLVRPGFAPADGKPLTTYSIVWDIYAPGAVNHWMALLQTDPTNRSDADFLINMDAGIGISGNYTGKFDASQWQRVGLTVKDNGDGTLTLSKYLQGQLVGEQKMDASRYAIDPQKGFLIFSDEGHFQWNFETLDGYVSSVFFTDAALTTQQMTELGGASAGGVMQAADVDPAHAVQFDFNKGALAPSFGAGTLSLWDNSTLVDLDGWKVQGTANAPGADGVNGEGALHDRSDAAGKHLVWDNADARQWSNYIYDVTLKSTDNDDIGVLFYYQDAANHYRFVMDNEAVSRKLIKVSDGLETVLAQTSAGYRFNDDLDLRVVVSGDKIDIILDGRSVFDGPVSDATPLNGGTIGVYSGEQKSSILDDVMVNRQSLTAHGESALRVIAEDGADSAMVELTARSSFGPDDIVAWRWLVDGEVVATTAEAAIELGAGARDVVLEVTDSTGKTATDIVHVTVAGARDVLARNGFNGDALGSAWSILDEGDIEGPSDWVIQDGRLFQNSNIYSKQLTAGGPSNPDDWQKGWSPLGDGNFMLRKGTIAVYDGDNNSAHDWKDYSIDVSFRTPDDDGLGVVFYYQDPNNYYKLELNHQYNVWTLLRMQDGIEEQLGQAWNKYALNQDTHLRVDIVDNQIMAWIDDEALFPYPIEDRGLSHGAFGLYSWGSKGVSFDDVTVVSLANRSQISGTDGDDVLSGTAGDDIILAGAGDDIVAAGAGDDEIDGGSGDDRLDGGDGDDLIRGGAGDDELIGGAGGDLLAGGAGDDLLDGGDGVDTVSYADDTNGVEVNLATGEASGDEAGLDALVSIENIIGGAGDDILIGDANANRIEGGAGDDVIRAGTGDDLIIAGAGDDQVDGGAGYDTLDLSAATAPVQVDFAAGKASGAGIGVQSFTNIEKLQFGAADDVATGGSGKEALAGGAGDDVLNGGAGDDVLWGEAGDDQLDGGSGADHLLGGAGQDVIRGGSGDDLIEAGAGNDSVNGGSGADRIIGGAGDDVLTGGSGNDVFVFAANFGHDRITDFRSSGGSADVLEFAADIFADYDAAMAAATQQGADTVITVDADHSVTLTGVQIASLQADDFRFV